MTDPDSSPTENLPFVAPCRILTADAPWRWLALGWRDLRAGGLTSVACGAAIVLLSTAVVGVAAWLGTGWMLLVLLSAFIFVAPVLCLTFYAVSASLARGCRPGVRETFRNAHAHLADALVYSQIVLSLVLPVPMLVLLYLTGRTDIMGAFATGRGMRWLAGAAVVTVVGLNAIYLLHSCGLPLSLPFGV